MQKEIFDRLAEKYLSGEADEGERQLIEEYLRRMEKQDSGEFSDLELDKTTSSLYIKIQAELKKSSVLRSFFHRSLWFKMSAVAAAAILLIVGYFYYPRSSSQKKHIADGEKAMHHTLVPGADMAVLTLSDGSQVMLDSNGNAAIPLQGLTAVTNSGRGLLYNASGKENIETVTYNTVSTPKGGQYRITLADGSRVWLNAMASIRFPTAFAGNERSVEVTGETYFEVAKDSLKPFHVKVNDIDIQALGTQFNINAYLDETSIKTTLLEGSVQVTKAGYKQLLLPGQQARVAEDGGIELVHAVDLEQIVAWKNGLFNLTGSNIREIMRQIGRWYNAEVEYEGDVSGIDFYGAVTRTKNITELLGILEKTGIVHFRIEGQKIVVSK